MSVPDASTLSFVSQPNAEDLEQQMANLALICHKYKDKYTNFPRERGWIADNLYMYQNFWHESESVISVETVMAAQETFKAHPTDIYVATLPKSGTTWLMAIVFATLNRNINKNSIHPLLKFHPHDCVPCLEVETLKTTPTYVDAHLPRLFSTHIPYTSLPKSILDSGCRLVYMCRNPKDVLVSYFHFANKLRRKSQGLLKIDEAFEMFSKGIMASGPYWDHVKGYYDISLKHPTRILFLTYEGMKKDPVTNVRCLAEFLGCPFTAEEEAEGVVEEIVRLCSFETLSEVNKHGDFRENMPNGVFFRNGKVGDWSKHLTKDMSQMLDQITTEKFQGLNISF